jgi:hypothetical protein
VTSSNQVFIEAAEPVRRCVLPRSKACSACSARWRLPRSSVWLHQARELSGLQEGVHHEQLSVRLHVRRRCSASASRCCVLRIVTSKLYLVVGLPAAYLAAPSTLAIVARAARGQASLLVPNITLQEVCKLFSSRLTPGACGPAGSGWCARKATVRLRR